jgi:hypothetical protein
MFSLATVSAQVKLLPWFFFLAPVKKKSIGAKSNI